LLRELIAREGNGVVITRGSTFENRANPALGFFDSIVRRYEGTRLGRQELNAEMLEDVEGALWSLAMIERARISSSAVPDLTRIVVAIDSAGSTRKAHGNTPLLETSSMRDSIEWDAPHHDGNVTYGDVGSDNPKAVWHELGTKHIPPRSFLGQAAMGKEREITEMMAKEVTKAMVLGGPNYRGMREVMHVLHAAYEKTKELGEEVLEEPESD